MSTLKFSAVAVIALLGSAVLTSPSFAVEPDVDSTAGPQLPAPRHEPGFQVDDQAGATKLVPQAEVYEAPVIIVPDAEPLPPPPPEE
jgi:hypothetical protein